MSSWRSGNVLFLILLAVALFAALSYAVTQAGRSGGKDISDEKARLDQAELENYQAALSAGRMRLEIVNGCDSIDYTPPEDWVSGDKFCHMFHPDGAGVAYKDLGDGFCPNGDAWTTLEIDESCGSIVYSGVSGGNRIYTTLADQGDFQWKTTADQTIGADSSSDGIVNTDAIEIAGLSDHPAAQACRSLGSAWYLPARFELDEMLSNLGNNGSFSVGVWYWSSTQSPSGGYFTAFVQRVGSGASNMAKDSGTRVRCVRRG